MSTEGKTRFYLKLFGGFQLSDGRGDVRLRGDKLRAILALLVCEQPKAPTREYLIALLWGSHSEARARQNLRQALVRLRKVLGPDVLTSDGDLVGLAEGALTSDVQELERCESLGDNENTRLVIDRIEGTFLPGLVIREQLWEEWLRLQRERLNGLVVDAMVSVGEHCLQNSQPKRALKLGQRVLVLDFFREDGHCIVMRALAALGRRVQALQHYKNLADELARELGVDPENTTVSCWNEINAVQTEQAPYLSRALQRAPASLTEETSGQDLPTVAVLPFDNIGAASRQTYFADGIADEIIAALARLSWFYTIARSSSFLFRGRSVNIRHVGRILGARYILEGSVQRIRDRVRIIPHLIDADRGTHIWADRFDTAPGDIFEVQDLITSRILAGIVPAIQNAEITRSRDLRSEIPNAYDLYLQALPHYQAHTGADLDKAAKLLGRARERDPSFALAGAMEACSLWRPFAGMWKPLSTKTLERAFELAERALNGEKSDPVVLAKSATVLGLGKGEHKASLELCREALRVAPFHPFVVSSTAWMEIWSGEHESAINHLRFGEKVFPCGTGNHDVLTALAAANFYLGNYDLSLDFAQRAHDANSNHAPSLRYQAACYVEMNDMAEARTAMEKCLAIQPHCTVSFVRRSGSLQAKDPEMLTPYLNGLQLAGMPA